MYQNLQRVADSLKAATDNHKEVMSFCIHTVSFLGKEGVKRISEVEWAWRFQKIVEISAISSKKTFDSTLTFFVMTEHS